MQIQYKYIFIPLIISTLVWGIVPSAGGNSLFNALNVHAQVFDMFIDITPIDVPIVDVTPVIEPDPIIVTVDNGVILDTAPVSTIDTTVAVSTDPIIDTISLVDAGGDAGTTAVDTVDTTIVTDVGGDAGTLITDAPVIDVGGDAGTPAIDTPIVDVGGDAGTTAVDTPIIDVGGDAGTPAIDTPVVTDIPTTPTTPVTPPLVVVTPIPVFPLSISGCTDSTATNYNSSATVNDGSCTYPAPIFGCMDSTATNYNPAATSQTGIVCLYPPAAPVCVLTAAPAAIQTGASSILSWTTANATAFSVDNGIGNVAAAAVTTGSQSVSPVITTTYTGTATGLGGSVTCAATITVTALPPPPPPATAPLCTLTASPTAVTSGSVSTLSWTTTDSATFSIDNSIGSVSPVPAGSTTTAALAANTTFTGTATDSAGKTATCTAIVTITVPPPPGCTSNCGGGGGGGGGGRPSPNITLLARPHTQPLAYLYLSQIPYTGLDLGPMGTVLYWLALISFTLALAYAVLFGAAPAVNRSLRNFGTRVFDVLNAQEPILATAAYSTPAPAVQTVQNNTVTHQVIAHSETVPEAPRTHSSYDGFKSYARNGVLSIEDIVKSLSQHQAVPQKGASHPNVEPVYANVEPIYENVESITTAPVVESNGASASTRGFASALLEGDRVAVFAGLRQQVRGGGRTEKLLSETVCLLDDVYRARIDGTPCDADVARLAARLSTPTLEKLVTSLTTAIDSSYSEGVTGAKLALTRALTVLGA